MEHSFLFTNLMTSTDQQLLDLYSSTVTGVVKKTSQAVVHLRVLKKIQNPLTKKIAGQYAMASGFGWIICISS